MFEDSDPGRELWEGDAAARSPPGQSGESSKGDARQERQWGGGCQSPASCFPLRSSLWERETHAQLVAARPSQAEGDAEVRSCNEAGVFPWGEESPPLDHHLSCWTCHTEAVGRRRWCLGEPALERRGSAALGSSRTLCHPSFQSVFTAAAAALGALGAGGHVSSSESKFSAGDLPLVDCTSCYYTDPTLPPGLRIYNWLSGSSQEVCRSLSLNTPAPIMAVCEAAPPRRLRSGSRWLSDLELKAISALLELPAGTHQASCPITPPFCHEQWRDRSKQGLQ